MDSIKSDPYPEDIQKLYNKYSVKVVRSLARVLVNSSLLIIRSAYPFYDLYGLAIASAEVNSDVPREATWVRELTSALERALLLYACTPEVDVVPEDNRPIESDGCVEPEAIIEDKNLDDVQEKLCDDGLSLPRDGDGYDKDKVQEGTTKRKDSEGDRDIYYEQEFPDKVDIFLPYCNRYEDKEGMVSV